MKNRKSTRGFTLVELIVSVAMLSIVMAAAGSAMFAAAQSYAETKKMQDDEYNARLALLAITREVHRGVTELDASGSELRILAYDGTTEIVYTFDDTAKILRRSGDIGSTPVQFAETELERFTASSDGRLLTLEIEGRNGLNLKTTVAILRVPAPADTTE